MVDVLLLAACSNGVPVETVQALIQVESSGNPLALSTNPSRPLPDVRDTEAAGRLLESLLQAGASVDIGLMQINSQHLLRFGVSGRDLLDPCTNVFVGTSILRLDYERMSESLGPGQQALRAAISAYNTGSPTRGFENGYVERVLRAAGVEDGPSGDIQSSPIAVRGYVPAGPGGLRWPGHVPVAGSRSAGGEPE